MITRAVLLLVSIAVAASAVAAEAVPPRAHEYLPMLRETQRKVWPDIPVPSVLAAQIEQETCYSPTHSKCWNPRAEMKTSREYGFGLGQITRAYHPDGSVRFDIFSELKQKFAELRDWRWEDRYDPQKQILAMVLMDQGIYRRVDGAATPYDRLAMTMAAYNGGEGGLRQDRLMCRQVQGCDPGRWFGHVEHHSRKSRTPWAGYGGQSAFSINRGYVRNVMITRRPKYEAFFR